MNPQSKLRIQCCTPPVVHVDGDLVSESAMELEKAISCLIHEGHLHLTLNLAGVPCLDSVGFGAIERVQEHLRTLGGSMRLADASIIHSWDGVVLPRQWRVRRMEGAAAEWSGAELRQMIVEASQEAGFDEACCADIQLAVGEAFANAIRHGSPNPERCRIFACCLYAKGYLMVEIEDEGPGFDPDSVPAPKIGELREGGMGIYLMRALMDEIVYFHGCPGMRVRLAKRIGG